MADWLRDFNTIMRGTFAPTPKGPFEDTGAYPTGPAPVAPPLPFTPVTQARSAMSYQAGGAAPPAPEGDVLKQLFSREGLGSVFTPPPSYQDARKAPPTPSLAPSGAPSLNSAIMAFNPAEGGRVVDGLRGLTQAQPRQVTNPNPSGRNGQVPIGALLELAKVMPKPKQQSFGEQLVGMQFARLQQQLAAAKDPKMIEEISKRMDSLAIAGNRGNPMNYSLSSLLGQGNE
jgi:hypothetical protein